jgi:hypothetical protein
VRKAWNVIPWNESGNNYDAREKHKKEELKIKKEHTDEDAMRLGDMNWHKP